MKTGRTLTELAQEIVRQKAAKLDIIAPTRRITAEPIKAGVALNVAGRDGESKAFDLTPHAFGQLASYADVPKAYADRLATTNPELLADNLNHWLRRKPATEARMVRVLDGHARALLSNSYRRIDHDLILETMLPLVVSGALGELTVRSCEVTDKRLYVKVVSPSLVREVKVGDPVAFGFSFGNCEIGGGSFFCELFVEQLRCTNGMRVDVGVRKAHLGRRIAADEEAVELFASDTLRADDRALQLKMRDTIKGLLSPASIELAFGKFREAATSQPIEVPDKAVEVLAQRFTLNDAERGSVLKHLALGGDLSRWGAAAAVTRTAEDLGDYDRASTLEALGWDIIDLPKDAWREVATAA